MLSKYLNILFSVRSKPSHKNDFNKAILTYKIPKSVNDYSKEESLKEENSRLKQKIESQNELKEKIEEYKRKISELEEENEKLLEQFEAFTTELESLITNNNEFESLIYQLYQEISEKEGIIHLLKKRIYDLTKGY